MGHAPSVSKIKANWATVPKKEAAAKASVERNECLREGGGRKCGLFFFLFVRVSLQTETMFGSQRARFFLCFKSALSLTQFVSGSVSDLQKKKEKSRKLLTNLKIVCKFSESAKISSFIIILDM
jgi:hypothetical protein